MCQHVMHKGQVLHKCQDVHDNKLACFLLGYSPCCSTNRTLSACKGWWPCKCMVVIQEELGDVMGDESCRFMPGKEGPFTKKAAEDEGDYLERYGTEPCIEVGLVREFQVQKPAVPSRTRCVVGEMTAFNGAQLC